jgi:hypothetical protein
VAGSTFHLHGKTHVKLQEYSHIPMKAITYIEPYAKTDPNRCYKCLLNTSEQLWEKPDTR